MSINIGDNFGLKTEKFNFERDAFATKSAMKAYPLSGAPNGFRTLCLEDGKQYKLDKNGTNDATTGYWVIAEADVDLSDYYTKSEVYSKSEINNKNYVDINYFNMSVNSMNQSNANTYRRKDDSYNKTEVDNLVSGGSTEALKNYYTKTETNTQISGAIQSFQTTADTTYAAKSNTYTKEEVDAKIGEGGGTDMTNYYTKTEVDAVNREQNRDIENLRQTQIDVNESVGDISSKLNNVQQQTIKCESGTIFLSNGCNSYRHDMWDKLVIDVDDSEITEEDYNEFTYTLYREKPSEMDFSSNIVNAVNNDGVFEPYAKIVVFKFVKVRGKDNDSKWTIVDVYYPDSKLYIPNRRLDFLESTGTQWIDTGLKVTDDFEFESDIEIFYNKPYMCAFGTENIPNSYEFRASVTSSGRSMVLRFGKNESIQLLEGSRKMKLFRRDGIQGINNNIIESPAPLIESTYNIHLFGLNRGGFSKDRFFGRIYGFKVYDKGELVQSLVPAWDDNGIVCMFDEVNNKYLYNQGTGDFLYADISDKITPVKYIESTGTQWVNTNYVHTDKTKLDWTVMITSDNINFVPLGARQKADENSTSQFIMWFKNQSELTAQIGSTNMEHKLFWSGHKLNWVASPTESIITDEDGTVYRNSSTSTIVSGNTYPLYIGGANYGNASCRCIAQRFYGLKIYEGEEIMMDLIPALDSNNIPIVYDNISGRKMYNQGSGSFLYEFEDDKVPYTELEFIQSSGTQWIDTEVIPDSTSIMQVDYQFTKLTDSINQIMGSRINTVDKSFCFGNIGVNKKLWYELGGQGASIADINNLNRNQVELNLNYIKINGVNYPVSNTDYDMTGARSIYLFGANFTGEEAFRHCSVKLFSSKIYQGNLLVQDLIPVLDEDGIICMFDKVKKKYHYNKGTSVFKGGAKGDSPYTEVEYLQSKDGYQYINLGRTAGINTGFEMKLWCNTTHNKRYKAFFGVEDTSNKGDFRFTYQATDTIVAYVGGNGTHNVINIPNSSGDIVLSYNPTNKTVTSNGVNYVYSTVKDFQTTNTMYLFNMNRAGNNSSDAYYGKIYYTKIYESGELVMDLIPVIDFLGRPAMYDRVNSKYYYNQGGTEFTTPLEYTEVEYLEASGNQYIDTKTKRKSVYSSEVKIMMNETISNEKPIFGGRNSLADALVLFYRLSNNTLELTAGSLGVTPVTNIEKGVEYVVNITNKSLNVVGGSVNFTKDISNNISTDGISDIALFTFINSGGSVDSRKFEGRIYSYKLINGTILVQDFIPVLDSYGEACMYDRVTNTFFYNSGSGNFKTNLTDISND